MATVPARLASWRPPVLTLMRRAAPRVPRYSAVGQARPFVLRARGEDEPPAGIEPMTGARARAQRRAKEKIMQRAVLGIEPRTSRTRSENHATRPSSQLVKQASWIKKQRQVRYILQAKLIFNVSLLKSKVQNRAYMGCSGN